MSHSIDTTPSDRCRVCRGEYFAKAYLTSSGNLIAVKECACSRPSTHDLTDEPAQSEGHP